ncbi:MAG TPA: hypothetical protein ENK06_10990 [Gammaproteobacteria bacterium]|nr:hypothetical protein [Gammaproteobacteria bacterium]
MNLSSLWAQDLPIVKNSIAFSYDQLQLPIDEGMGLLGGNYLFAVGNHGYSGLGVYGAVKGQRGGFFTGGLALGWRKGFLKNYFFDVNAFAGGGGGGGAPQGGGLMLRTAFEAGINAKQNSLGLGISYVGFPNGDISSRQISINYRYSFEAYHFSGWPDKLSDNNRWLTRLYRQALAKKSQFALQLTRYFPKDSLGRSGKSLDKQLDILGIHWRNEIARNAWFEFETGGAMLGNIDGFAQVFSGLSYEYKLSQGVYTHLGFLVGAAGGGDVNTGGGIVYRTFGGLGYRFNSAWSLLSQLAWTAALERQFKAPTVLLNLVYHYRRLSPAPLLTGNKALFNESISWHRYRIRSGFQRYSYYRGAGRKSSTQKNIDVNLVNLKLDSFVNNRVYVTGHALGAVTGKAGGYAVGLLGAGYQLNAYFSGELLLGVAGGGGIAVGSGQIVQPMINGHLPLSERWALEASLGYIRAMSDSLSAVVTNIALAYRFQSPTVE